MSTILKALKKLEQDKLKKGEGQSEIAFDILKASPPSGPPRMLPVVVSVAVLVLVAAATLYLMAFPRQVAESSDPLQPLPGVASKAVSSAKQVPGTSRTAPEKTKTARSASLDPGAEKHAAGFRQNTRKPEKPLAAEPSRAETVPARRWSVSGIAWQENEEERLAVINGLPVMTGTVIDDATVTAIEEDRVILTYGGKSLPVPLEPPNDN